MARHADGNYVGTSVSLGVTVLLTNHRRISARPPARFVLRPNVFSRLLPLSPWNKSRRAFLGFCVLRCVFVAVANARVRKSDSQSRGTFPFNETRARVHIRGLHSRPAFRDARHPSPITGRETGCRDSGGAMLRSRRARGNNLLATIVESMHESA